MKRYNSPAILFLDPQGPLVSFAEAEQRIQALAGALHVIAEMAETGGGDWHDAHEIAARALRDADTRAAFPHGR